MEELVEFIFEHTSRGECTCGKCLDKGPDREAPAHSVDVHFFWVSLSGQPKKEDLFALLKAQYPNMDRLKQGLSYVELGGELGSQEAALRLIGLGGLLELWPVVTPASIEATGEAAAKLAGSGFVMSGGWS